jgi:N,N'-diacetyllegionaminate synthase
MIDVIAEIGWNHMGDMNLAKRMIDRASDSGATYAKFQTWKVNRLKPGPWDDDGRRQIYEKAELSDDDHFRLKQHCESKGIRFLTSCFAVEDLSLIRRVTDEVKIPSTECSNSELVLEAIDKFQRVFISIGASTVDEYARWANYKNVWLLHCVSTYPCPLENANLLRIRRLLECTPRVGYSGHCAGNFDGVVAAVLGARVIEKHFTISHGLPGRDNKFALLPSELGELVKKLAVIELMSVDGGPGFQDIEKDAREVYSGRWS